jgi:hypothetical protein
VAEALKKCGPPVDRRQGRREVLGFATPAERSWTLLQRAAADHRSLALPVVETGADISQCEFNAVNRVARSRFAEPCTLAPTSSTWCAISTAWEPYPATPPVRCFPVARGSAHPLEQHSSSLRDGPHFNALKSRLADLARCEKTRPGEAPVRGRCRECQGSASSALGAGKDRRGRVRGRPSQLAADPGVEVLQAVADRALADVDVERAAAHEAVFLQGTRREVAIAGGFAGGEERWQDFLREVMTALG